DALPIYGALATIRGRGEVEELSGSELGQINIEGGESIETWSQPAHELPLVTFQQDAHLSGVTPQKGHGTTSAATAKYRTGNDATHAFLQFATHQLLEISAQTGTQQARANHLGTCQSDHTGRIQFAGAK